MAKLLRRYRPRGRAAGLEAHPDGDWLYLADVIAAIKRRIRTERQRAAAFSGKDLGERICRRESERVIDALEVQLRRLGVKP